MAETKSRPLWVWVLLVYLLALILAGVWRFTPLQEYASPERLRQLSENWREQAWMPLAILAVYILANSVMFPNMVINTSTILTFGGLYGWSFAIIGSLTAGSLYFFVGRHLGLDYIERQQSKGFKKLCSVLKRGGLWTVVIARMVPIAPFTLVNSAAGAIGIKYWQFFGGTFLGLLPGTLTTSILRDRYLALAENYTAENALILLAVALVATALIIFFAKQARKYIQMEENQKPSDS